MGGSRARHGVLFIEKGVIGAAPGGPPGGVPPIPTGGGAPATPGAASRVDLSVREKKDTEARDIFTADDSYQGAMIETHRDRPCGPSGRREAAGDAFASSRFSDALRRAAWTTGTAAFQGFRTSSRTLCDAPHRRAARTLKAENLGKPSLWVSIIAPWYQSTPASKSGMAARSAFVYGCSGWLNRLSTSAISTILPERMTATLSHIYLTTLRSCVINR